MSNPLLSIVVPTYNRYPYLEKLIELIDSFNEDEIELVIHDNTEDNSEIVSYLSSHNYRNVQYFHRKDHIPVTLNSDLAILNSSGKYVCFIGDDDGVMRNILDYVKWMDENGIDSLRSEPPISYSWPGSKGIIYDSSSKLLFHKPTGKREIVTDFKKVRKYNLRRGGLEQSKNPRIYCGILRRDILFLVYEKTGTFFPGPSPDMASSTALGYYVKKHAIIDDILVLAGSCPKSAAGMGRQHKHSGRIEDVPWLPKNTAELWEERIPKLWTGETIYAESTIKAIKALDHTEDLRFMNYPYLYASFLVYHPHDWKVVRPHIKLKSVFPFCGALLKVFSQRLHSFLKNVAREKLGINDCVLRYDNVSDIIKCERIIFEVLNKPSSV